MNATKIIIGLLVFAITLTIIYFIPINRIGNNTIEAGGGLETAYVIWQDTGNISSYNVYIKNVKENDYKQLDKELIRKYKNANQIYWRADALGLEEGEYKFKIVPISNQKENESNSITTNTIFVNANVRQGFSFAKNSTNGGHSSGGYLENGTISEDARIIYITKENVNTVTLNINKDNQETIVATGISDILAKWKEEAFSKHLIIRILGKLDKQDVNGLNATQSILIKECKGVTIEGIGNDATLNGIGISIEESSNIEVRNLGIMLFHEDAISLDKNNYNIWIHNNDIFYGEDRGGDKSKGDGATDILASKYITISYNHYWDSAKTSLCGLENDLDYITYHHNWFDHSDSRCPRVRYASVHVYNNYYVGGFAYSVGASNNSSVFAEANYFKDCKYPMLISSQGWDYENSVMSGEPGGIIKSYNNLIEGKNINLTYFNEDNTQFDSYLANSRMEKVPEECKTLKGNYTYNNFDTNSMIMYEYIVDNPEQLEEIITINAGRLQGGDIKFDTNELSKNSRSRLDKMEKELDYLINNYETSLVYTQID